MLTGVVLLFSRFKSKECVNGIYELIEGLKITVLIYVVRFFPYDQNVNILVFYGLHELFRHF